MKIIQFIIKANGWFPNNPVLPVLLYKGALRLPDEDSEELVKEVFQQNNWSNAWVNGIYSYHHYHSITHEVLGIVKGRCNIMLGGERGIRQTIERGDALLIPAGVAHRNLDSTPDFSVVGAYPEGKDFDILYGKPEEFPDAAERIKHVPLPATDPLYGNKGPLFEHWKTILIHP